MGKKMLWRTRKILKRSKNKDKAKRNRHEARNDDKGGCEGPAQVRDRPGSQHNYDTFHERQPSDEGNNHWPVPGPEVVGKDEEKPGKCAQCTRNTRQERRPSKLIQDLLHAAPIYENSDPSQKEKDPKYLPKEDGEL